MSIHSRLTRLTVMLCVGVLSSAGITLAASPAQAEPAETHCMIVLPGPSEQRCFASFDEARRWAEEHGAIGPSKEEATGSRDLRQALATAPRAGVATVWTLIGVEFSLPFYLGSSRWVYGANGPCSLTVNDIDYQLPDWSVYGFDQTISSFQGRNICWAEHHDLKNYGGFSVGPQGSQLVINAGIDNDTSSEEWT